MDKHVWRGPRAILAAVSMVAAGVALGATPAFADQQPAGCTSNSLALTITKDRTLIHNGDTSHYTASAANDTGAACDITHATVTLRLPAADGSPTGQLVTLASNANFPAGSAARVLGTVPYTVAVNPGVSDAVVEGRVAASCTTRRSTTRPRSQRRSGRPSRNHT
jgi:hypothetical protein